MTAVNSLCVDQRSLLTVRTLSELPLSQQRFSFSASLYHTNPTNFKKQLYMYLLKLGVNRTCNLFSLGTISAQSKERSSFCKKASSCSRNLGLWTPFGINSFVCLAAPGLRSGALGPRACAGHVSNVPALVSM